MTETMLESISDGLFALDRERRFVYVNGKAEQVFDKPREELLGKRIWEVFPQVVGTESYQAIERAAKEGITTEFEFISSVAPIWVLGRAYPFAEGVTVYFQDITDRKRGEEALRESEERYRLIVERARDYAILTTDPEGLIDSWSPGAGEVYGWTAEEALGRHSSMLFVQEDRENGVPEKELTTARKEGAADDVRWHLRKDGARVYIEGSTRALRHGGKKGELRGFLKIGQDVTRRRQMDEELRASEERFRTLMENVRDYAIFMLDVEGVVTEWTEGAKRVMGYAAEEVLGKHVSTFYTPEEVASGEWERELAQAAREGRAERESWRVRKGGERIFVNEIATAVRDEEGKLVGFTKISRDLTERRREQKERQRFRAQALTAQVEATERKRISRQLHDRVAHSMAVAHQSLELYTALSDRAPDRAQDKLELAKEATKSALNQTRNLAMELRYSVAQEVENGLEEALKILVDKTVPDGVSVDLSFSGDDSVVPPEVGAQVFLVVREAFTNVLKHSGCDRVEVSLTVRPNEMVGVVRDNGDGFNVEEAAADGRRSGMGLDSMRERAQMLGGELNLISKPGDGTTVNVRMPLGA